MKELILKIFEAWKSGKRFDPALFGENFIYSGSSKMVDADVWLNLDAEGCVCENVNLLSIVSSEDQGAMLFEWVDDITLLKYRTSWFAKSNNGVIIELIEIREAVEK